jgi:hypothetical protein
LLPFSPELLSSHLLSKNVKIVIYKNIILPVVLYMCETWSLILREEHKMRVFEDRALRRIFGPKRVEVTGGWGKLHIEELHNLYSPPSITRMMKSRRMIWVGHVARRRRRGMHMEYWWEGQKKRDHSEEQDVGGWIILKWILES